ncbi:MAG TPA: hypothetical protein VLT47_16005, partial [Anaeromyxobacteraceae bacterium]|nr:hypothetical protein [Anaeromyxobacteraceae bacterium]
GALRGLGPVGRANPWYDVIGEFQPMFLGRTFTPAEDLRFAWLAFGLLPLLAALGAWKVMGGGPHAPARRGQIALLAAAAVALPALWIVRRRFDLYAIVPLVLLAAAAARRLSERALGSRAPRWVPAAAIAVLALAAVPTAPAIADLGTEQDPGMAPVARIAQRLGAAVASGAATPGIIVCSWSRGHHARFFSGLPALVTPFGSDAGPDAMSDWARLMLARTPAEADAVLTSRGARWWLLEPLVVDWALAHRLVPLGAPPVVAGKDGAGWVASPEGAALVSVRLARRDGNAWPGAPALSGYRLVDEDFRLDAPEQAAKLFERVPGAALRVTGAAPADRVLATVALVSPTGRATSLALEATADDGGRASLTLPYATGRNGFVDAGPWSVTSGGVTREVTVAEREVLGGGAVHVALAR